jgi:hypothetical protein
VRAPRESFFFPLFVIILMWVKVRIGRIGILGLSGFLALLFSSTYHLIVNFLEVISVSGCKLVKLNHLNLGIACDLIA